MPASATPNLREDHASQIPALLWLQKLGYTYLAPAPALAARGGRSDNVLLETVLRAQLARLNAVRHRGQDQPFSDDNLAAAIQALRELPGPLGFGPATHAAYDLLTLGKSFEQVVGGDRKSFSLRYIDWQQPASNVYHVTSEFAVQRSGLPDTYRPDVVLFVNGIPLAVLECKRAAAGLLDQAIAQHLRQQTEEGIRPLYIWSQLLLVADGDQARYATTATRPEFWATWREQHPSPEAEAAWEQQLLTLKNQPPRPEQEAALFSGEFAYAQAHFRQLQSGPQLPTGQDRALWSLCQPRRLLDLAFHFVLYEDGQKKIARYQQFFGVRATLERVQQRDADGRRLGGVLWHTQGSGKSLTMVMLAQLLATDPRLPGARIVLVTDRTDLDEQIGGTFLKCGKLPKRARSGQHLRQLLHDPRAEVITTLINKFDKAVRHLDAPLADDNIFVLIDEGHRSQYGSLHARMRQVLPRACFLAFTGTPLLKREKSTAARFGGLIDPPYTIRQAVEDKAVVPLLYEGRHVVQAVNARPLDRFFEVVTEPLGDYQRADLKHKVSRAAPLNEAEQKIQEIALDISQHFSATWAGTGLKGQLVAGSKKAALKYKAALDMLGQVTSEVLISGPDEREGTDDAYAPEATDPIVRFWKRMMDQHGSPEQYQKNVINAFKYQDQPELIIVVDKLLTGFDAPRNTVLYLTRGLREHSLLQAIARVNRVHPGKDFGYIIDYYGNLQQLDAALSTYSGLDGFDEADLADTLAHVRTQVEELPRRHAVLWDLFRAVPNRYDAEAYQQLLADAALRHDFYAKVAVYARLLRLALSTLEFTQRNPPAQVEQYRHDGAFFLKLREQARQRYADTVDYRQYEAQVQKLIDTHLSTEEVIRLTQLVNIFDEQHFAEVVAEAGTPAAQADTIAHRTARTITEKLDEDPARFRRLSELIAETIADYRARRISEAEYLQRARDVQQQVLRHRTAPDTPAALKGRPAAQAFYGLTEEALRPATAAEAAPRRKVAIHAGLHLDDLLRGHLLDQGRPIVDWPHKDALVNAARLALDDYLFDLNARESLGLSLDAIDRLLDQVFVVARRQYA